MKKAFANIQFFWFKVQNSKFKRWDNGIVLKWGLETIDEKDFVEEH